MDLSVEEYEFAITQQLGVLQNEIIKLRLQNKKLAEELQQIKESESE